MPDTSTEPIDLHASAEALLAQARNDGVGRVSQELVPEPAAGLAQRLVALTAGQATDEQRNPGVATVQVVHGRVRLLAGEHHVELAAGGYTPVPPVRHTIEAVADSVLLMTVATNATVDA